MAEDKVINGIYSRDGKRYKVYCECTANWIIVNRLKPSGEDYNEALDVGICKECGFYPWIYPHHPLKEDDNG